LDLIEKTCIVISVEKYHNIFSDNDETRQEHIIAYVRAMIITFKCRFAVAGAPAAAARPLLKTYTHRNTEDIYEMCGNGDGAAMVRRCLMAKGRFFFYYYNISATPLPKVVCVVTGAADNCDRFVIIIFSPSFTVSPPPQSSSEVT